MQTSSPCDCAVKLPDDQAGVAGGNVAGAERAELTTEGGGSEGAGEKRAEPVGSPVVEVKGAGDDGDVEGIARLLRGRGRIGTTT